VFLLHTIGCSLGGFVMQQATVFAACKIARYLARGVRVTEGY
jgi:hypothetical protein